MGIINIDDINAEIQNVEDGEAFVITIEDGAKIQTKKYCLDEYLDNKTDKVHKFKIKKRDANTISSSDDGSEDEDSDEYEPAVSDVEGEFRYYDFCEGCCCGLLRLAEEPLTYLHIVPRFQIDVAELLRQNLAPRECCVIGHGLLEEKKVPESLREEYQAVCKAAKEIGGCFYRVDMPQLFEAYAKEKVKNIFSEWDWVETPKVTLEIVDGKNEKIKSYIGGDLKPDIVLKKGDKYIILDVKYKDYGNLRSNGSRDDRLQLLAYAEVYDAHLIGHVFPQKSEENPENGDFRYGKINTRRNGAYYYFQFSLGMSEKVSDGLRRNIQMVIEKAGLEG